MAIFWWDPPLTGASNAGGVGKNRDLSQCLTSPSPHVVCTRPARYYQHCATELWQVVTLIAGSKQQSLLMAGPVHTGNKVDHIGNKVKRICNKVNHDKLSNSRCCRLVARTGKKVDRIDNSQLCCQFVAGFVNTRLSTKSTVSNSTLSQCVRALQLL